MEELRGWYAYRVYCNNRCIASFQTEALREQFVIDRSLKYPRNVYTFEAQEAA